ncbi:MAG: hypothetical protein K6G24_10830 [Lachnospiraceae bacterium]|nr:hypothetical protein [Lachnospiraceae bacterium]
MSEEKIMNLENEDLDIDFKNLFNDEFDSLDISVSDSLIAKTMAAIKLEQEKTEVKKVDNAAEKENDNGKIVNISERSNKKYIIKMVSGIAAALIIGVVGLFVFKAGRAERKADTAPMANSATESKMSETATADDSYEYDDMCVTEDASEAGNQSFASPAREKTNNLEIDSSLNSKTQNYSGNTSGGREMFEDSTKEETKTAAPETVPNTVTDSVELSPEAEDGGFDGDNNVGATDETSSGITEEDVVLELEDIFNVIGTLDSADLSDRAKLQELVRKTEGYTRLIAVGDKVKDILKELYAGSGGETEKTVLETILEDIG